MSRRSKVPVPAPRRALPRKRRRGLWIALSVVLVLVIAMGSAAAWYNNKINVALNNVNRSDMLPTGSTYTPRPYEPDKPVTFVLMGSDTRTSNAGQGRSDVLMVAYVSGDRKHVYLVSFPRDMYVPIPGHGKAKINAAFAWGGPPLTIATLEGLLGLPMDHAALIDFEGFIRLTDTLGGITVTNKVASQQGTYKWPKGTITLTTGDEALAYVRQRKELPNGDLDRAERQRAVTRSIIASLASPSTIANPQKFSATLTAVGACMTVDAGLTTDQIKTMAKDMRITSGNDVLSLQAPISGFGTTSDGQSIDVVDQPKMVELGKAMQTDTMADYFRKYGK